MFGAIHSDHLLSQQLAGLLLSEGDIRYHVLLQRRRVVFEIDGNDSLVALALEFFQRIGAIGLTFPNDCVAAVQVALLENIFEMEADDAAFQFPKALHRVQVGTRPLPNVSTSADAFAPVRANP